MALKLKLAKRTCRCGEEFQPRREWQLHCSDACRIEAFKERSKESHRRAIEKLNTIIDLTDDSGVANLARMAIAELGGA